VEFMFLVGGDLGVAVVTCTFEREWEPIGNMLGIAISRRMVMRPRYAVIELPLDWYAELDFVGTRKYAVRRSACFMHRIHISSDLDQCNNVHEMVEVVDGTLQYTNLKVNSWIKENMDYEVVQDAKIRDSFEVDLQEAKVRVPPLVRLLLFVNRKRSCA